MKCHQSDIRTVLEYHFLVVAAFKSAYRFLVKFKLTRKFEESAENSVVWPFINMVISFVIELVLASWAESYMRHQLSCRENPSHVVQ